MTGADAARAQQVILEIVRQAGGLLEGDARLHMAAYVAHLYYFEDCPGVLTQCRFVKAYNVPVIESADQLVRELVESGALAAEVVKVGPFPLTSYHLGDKAALLPALGPPEVDAVRKAVQFVQPKATVELA